jgi:hypothetical protein
MSAKSTLDLTTFCSALALCIIEIYRIDLYDRRRGYHLSHSMQYLALPLLFINGNLCRELTERIFKAIVWSRSSQTCEAPAGKGAGFAGCGADADRFEVSDRKLVRGFTLFMAIPWLIIVATMIASPPTEQDRDPRVGLLVLFTFGLVFAALMMCFGPARILLRGDSKGIFGQVVGFPRNEKRVPWSQIKACEIVTYYNRSAKPILIQPIFKDLAGKELLSLDLLPVKLPDQERLVKFIKTRLPKSPIDTWDL